MKPHRILIFSQYFYPEEFLVNELAVALKEDKSFEVDIITGQPNYPQGKIYDGYSLFKIVDNYEGIRIRRIPLFPRLEGRGWQLILNYLSFMFFASILAPFFFMKRYDYIFMFQLSPITAAFPAYIKKLFTKSKMILWVQDIWPDSLVATGAIKKGFLLRLVGRFVSFIYKVSDHIFIQATEAKDNILKYGDFHEKVHYFPNWAEDFYQLKPKNSTRKLIKVKGFKIVFAGNLGEAQNLDIIVEAAQIIEKKKVNISFVIIGSGRSEGSMKKKIAQANLKSIHFLGRKPRLEMPNYFAEADALLVTLRDEPIFRLTIPTKVQAYLAFGKPIIASINGAGNSVLKQSGAALVAEAEDSIKLAANCMNMARYSQKKLNTMSKKAKKYYLNNFDKKIFMQNFKEFLKKQI